MVIEQIKVGLDNFCYIIYCPAKGKAAIVDPGFNAAKILALVASKNVELTYIIITHYHRDHSGEIQTIKNAIPSAIIVASELDGRKIGVNIDRIVSDEDQLHLGNIHLKILLTPGHTPGSICILVDCKALLTGDTLFIGDCGRTDLPGGNLQQMFQTLHEKIMPFPDHVIIYPGHDYGDKPFDTLGNQKRTNKTLRAKNLDEFSRIP